MPPKDPEERVPYTAVLSDKYVQKKLASLGQYLLGEHNPVRIIDGHSVGGGGLARPALARRSYLRLSPTQGSVTKWK